MGNKQKIQFFSFLQHKVCFSLASSTFFFLSAISNLSKNVFWINKIMREKNMNCNFENMEHLMFSHAMFTLSKNVSVIL